MKIVILFWLMPALLLAQDAMAPNRNFGELLVTELASAPFPHPQRSQGHSYGGKTYSVEAHYLDSRVAVFIPRGYQPAGKVDLVFHFHGWYGSIDSVFEKYNLAEQFYQSGKNAILVVPQGPRDAPDSFGGKLEDPGGFKRLANDVVRYLFELGKIRQPEIGSIILSGHSGGYHVMAAILAQGGLSAQIKEVYLFDALYGQSDRYTDWLDRHQGKIINIYTEGGGTKGETQSLIAKLQGRGIPYKSLTEDQATLADLQDSRLVFLATKLSHDQVMHTHPNFREYLRASLLLNRETV